MPVRFLGAEANLYPGTAQFARQAGIPIFAVMKRHGRTRTPWICTGPFEPDPAPRIVTSDA